MRTHLGQIGTYQFFVVATILNLLCPSDWNIIPLEGIKANNMTKTYPKKYSQKTKKLTALNRYGRRLGWRASLPGSKNISGLGPPGEFKGFGSQKAKL